MNNIKPCFNCGGNSLSLFYDVRNVPVHSCLLIDNREEALTYPKGDIQLAFCRRCGFIENILFDPRMHEYSSRYEETQGFSARFQTFATKLAKRLIEQYNLREKHILEIGCGKGEFLVLLCEMGMNYGTGIDPGYISDRIQSNANSRITFLPDFYSEKYSHLSADFVVCRHTLEHIQSTSDFLKMVRRCIGDRHETIVYFEVPDVSRILKEQAFWDMYYEHCSYFTLDSLKYLFCSCGFEILNAQYDFDDQYLLVEARPTPSSRGTPPQEPQDLEQLAHDVKIFQETVPLKMKQWKETLQSVTTQDKRIVLWGSGSKAVAYLTTLDIAHELDYIVDINPHKHGKFSAGTGHEIVPPAFLKTYQPDLVVAMNPAYYDEIRSDLKQMGVEAELIAV
ncbi:class I SAM-dependent methyltransferase [Nitrospira sp. M1]